MKKDKEKLEGKKKTEHINIKRKKKKENGEEKQTQKGTNQ